jgi:citrate lyase subunit beta/citryl-CoA lyase
VVHPGQIGAANEVFTPGQEEFDGALALLDAYGHAARESGLGAVTLGADMIDEASAKMAERFAARGRAAGLVRSPARADGGGPGFGDEEAEHDR